MKNISYDNLVFLSEIIKNDVKIKNVRSNKGFSNTKINDVVQSRNLDFKTENLPLLGKAEYSSLSKNNIMYKQSVYQALEYKNKIHFIGNGVFNGSSSYAHYIYDVENCKVTQLSNLPTQVYVSYNYHAVIVVYNEKIHLVSQYTKKHYLYDENNDTWEVIEDSLPMDLSTNSNYKSIYGVVYNNKIHMFIHDNYNSSTATKHYSWDGTTWTELDDLPIRFYVSGSASTIWQNIVVYKNKIHFVVAIDITDSSIKAHYTWDETNGFNKVYTYSSSEGLYNSNNFKAFVYDDYLSIWRQGDKIYYWDDNNLFTFMTGSSVNPFYEYPSSASDRFYYLSLFLYKNQLYMHMYDYSASMFIIVRWAGGNWLLTKPIYYLDG